MKNTFSNGGPDGQWRNYYTGDKIDTSIGVATVGLSPSLPVDCGMLNVPWNGWTNLQLGCEVDDALPMVCACEHPGQMYLQLRGLCPQSNIDQFYVPRNQS